MRRLVVPVLAGLLLAPAAGAGGWATAKVSPLPPDSASGTQAFTITVLRHGVTPTDGAAPAVVLVGDDGTRHRFDAVATGRTGEYVARVEWPQGSWTFTVDDGLAATAHGVSATHELGTVEVERPAAANATARVPRWALPLAAAALLVAAAAAAGLRRRDSLRAPASAPAPE